ncbi:MAG: hypothetical protein FJX68_07725 [Alphaproteobacteria bacterium]|nr:hypothetical protein [Alphaproteobacteria bacterium]
MCGIVGLFLKQPGLQSRLGEMLAPMLLAMSERGPDSAGFAVYRQGVAAGESKLTLFHAEAEFDWPTLIGELRQADFAARLVDHRASHSVLAVAGPADSAAQWLGRRHPEIECMSAGRTMEIYKEVGRPAEVVERFHLADFSGTHALGHTRMATESAVTTQGSHPFSTGADLCLVHNGSLSNYHRLRRDLTRQGIVFRTENDSEVAAGYLTARLRSGASLQQALQSSLAELDGFYTFAVGTADGFAVLRDPIACKPAVLAETADWVAMGSEYRALAGLPGVAAARIWEPEPGRVYGWSRGAA